MRDACRPAPGFPASWAHYQKTCAIPSRCDCDPSSLAHLCIVTPDTSALASYSSLPMKVTSYGRSISGGMGQRLWFFLQRGRPGGHPACWPAAAVQGSPSSGLLSQQQGRGLSRAAAMQAAAPGPTAVEFKVPAGRTHVKKPWKRAKPQEPPHWMELEKRTVMGSSTSIWRQGTAGER